MSMYQRPSVYLATKAQALLDALAFFDETKEKRLFLLAQIDFWEWEIDNLIYSFETFNERAKVWDRETDIPSTLLKKGIRVKNTIMSYTKAKERAERWWKRWYPDKKGSKVVAPLDMLRDAIEKWNDVLSRCEQIIVETTQETIDFTGANLIPGLEKYRKKYPASLEAVTEAQ